MAVLHHESLGAGKAVLVLHGLFGSGANWRSVARLLAPRLRLILVDARNHGHSAHEPQMGYAQMVDDILLLMDKLGLEHASVLGHSMGGKTAMLLALKQPQRVRSLVIADIAPINYAGHDHASLIDAMRSLPLNAVNTRAEADQFLADRIPERALRAFLLHNLASVPGAQTSYRWRINLDAIQANLEELFAFDTSCTTSYSGPCLFIRGEVSDFITDPSITIIKQYFPNARVQTLAGAGHWLHAEQPQEFAQIVADFLDDVP